MLRNIESPLVGLRSKTSLYTYELPGYSQFSLREMGNGGPSWLNSSPRPHGRSYAFRARARFFPRAFINSFSGSVLMTSAFSSQPLRATPAPNRRNAKCS